MSGATCTRASQALSQTSNQTSLMAALSGHSALTWAHTAAQSTDAAEVPPTPTLPALDFPPEFVPPSALGDPPFA